MKSKKVRNNNAALILFLLVTSLWNFGARAETDPSQAEDKARNAFLDRFTKFTQDKNVMGKPKTATGQAAKGGRKTRFNQDDGLAYQSDLTYHDLAFNTIEQGNKNDKNAKVSRLFAFVSPHGGISAAGGSSLLERTAYQFHKQFTKEDTEENNKKDDEKAGIKYRSIFKITTQEVAKAQGGDNKKEADKVERWELREEVKPEIEKVGEQSFETIQKAARDEGFDNDPETLANGVRLRYAAGAATEAMYNSTLANLVQRRVNRGIRAGNFPDTPQLSEGVPTCDKWAAAANTVLNNVKGDQRKALQQEVQRMTQQCQQLAAMPANVINPRFVQPEKGGADAKDELKVEGPAKEDAFVRDSRVQLEVLNKASQDPAGVPSNWKYGAADGKARVTIEFDDQAKPLGEQIMTPKDQVESYNKQLQAAKEGQDEVATRLPDYKAVDPMQFQINADDSIVKINNKMSESAFDEVGLQRAEPPPPPTDYGQLLQKAQQ